MENFKPTVDAALNRLVTSVTSAPFLLRPAAFDDE